MKVPLLKYIHRDDKELIDFLTKRGCELTLGQGSDYYYADVDEKEKDKILEELRDMGLNLTPDYFGFYDKERYRKFKENEMKEYFKGQKVVFLRTTTLVDRLTNGWINDIFKLFELFPELEVVIDKEEDEWEGGSSLWEIYNRRGEKKIVNDKELDEYLDEYLNNLNN